ncbi:hypothetical protein C8A00DRAFT_37478 [Chaetomidium leptoderma]|uniref:tyrosine--tRNA ligase n=1 Tax=Chaetomidium leptoderma TaxID=669021 RepID=A0AAN6VEN3_9PEZI|nr:hypothetical protein C8A00DRAFT_37478 [Chaetomidium leptoderma]
MAIESQENMTFQTIAERLEVVNPERITEKLQAGEQVTGFWGTAPTGKPHIGYLVPLIKVAECIKAGFQVTILIGDHYAYLINYDVPLEIVEHRAQYYMYLMTAVLRSLGVPTSEIRIVTESTLSCSDPYQRDLMRMCAVTRQDEIRVVGPEIRDTAMLSPLLCPIRQALAEVYLGCDFQLGGLDQRGVFEYTRNCLPRIGYEPASHLMAAMIPGLKSAKMSSSAPADTKIMFSDSSDTVQEKIAGANLPVGNDTTNNGIMAMFEHIVFPFRRLRSTKPSIEIRLVSGVAKQYRDYDGLKEDVAKGVVDTEDLRRVLSRELNGIIGPVREEHAASSEWRLAEQLGYDMVDVVDMRL